ncbi:MAG: hypothetical protein IPP71_20680 [Bacteroidetes bacterium]|nr:hypothetical protein [Bacteroidota bacterium]
MKANNACGSSAFTNLAYTLAPAIPGNITGAVSVCKTQTAVVYSIAAVSGATSYLWSVTGGATIVGSCTGTSVTIKYTTSNSTSVVLSVKSKNSCSAYSAAKTITIAVNPNCRVINDGTIVLKDLQVYPNPNIR